MYTQQELKVYQLTFGIPREGILAMLDTRPEVLNWLAVFPGTILIISRSDITALTGVVHVWAPELHFLLSEVDVSRLNGWMNKEVWDFILSPKSSGRWE